MPLPTHVLVQQRAAGNYTAAEMTGDNIVALYPATAGLVPTNENDENDVWAVINASEDEIIAWCCYGPFTNVLSVCYTDDGVNDGVVATLRTMGLRD